MTHFMKYLFIAPLNNPLLAFMSLLIACFPKFSTYLQHTMAQDEGFPVVTVVISQGMGAF